MEEKKYSYEDTLEGALDKIRQELKLGKLVIVDVIGEHSRTHTNLTTIYNTEKYMNEESEYVSVDEKILKYKKETDRLFFN